MAGLKRLGIALRHVVLDQPEEFAVIENLVDLGKFRLHLDGELFDDCPEERIASISVTKHTAGLHILDGSPICRGHGTSASSFVLETS